MESTWHAHPVSAVTEHLGSGTDGLSEDEARERLAAHGPNTLPPPPRRSALRRLAAQFHNILLYVMLGAAVVTALLGHWIDTGVLLGAVIINAIIGFIQEGKAESALGAIRDMLSPRATVIRDGMRREIDAADLVPGDVITLSPGDRVPADVRLIQIRDFHTDESVLTGESFPAGKDVPPLPASTDLADRSGMAYSGTLAVRGRARGVVVATGTATELGKINQMLGAIPRATTPLLRRINHFSRWLAVVILALSAATYLIGVVVRGHEPTEMFTLAVALAASAIPEGLPAILTVTLSLGVQRMAARNAIVRRLPAVEALGSVTVICSDKTGTLTRNEMTVQRAVCADGDHEVSGDGYAPTGAITATSGSAGEALARMALAGVLCNDARLREDSAGGWHVEGDPTEGALLALGAKAGISQRDARAEWPRVDAIPFDSRHRLMATRHRDPEGGSVIFVKGAPEQVLTICDLEAGADGERPLDAARWHRAVGDAGARGLRVLAVAERRAVPSRDGLDFDDIEGSTLLGLVGIADPPRDEAIRAVRESHDAGIRVKMITGDNPETARAIGRRLDIGGDAPAVTGAEIERMDDDELQVVATRSDVFARASPQHKLRLVQALQADGQVTAMTGDGVNDAPALRRADIGIAMGRKGTEVAKEASDMVLADDNFASIAAAVREGRAVYDNVRMFILFMLPTNGGEALVVIAAILFELTLPLTAAQVLWINLATVSTLGVALAFEPAEGDVMRRPPRPPGEALLSGFFIWRIAFVSALMAAGTLGLFLWEIERGTGEDMARTIAVNTIVVAEMFYLVNSRKIVAPVLNRRVLAGNRWVVIAIVAAIGLQLAFTYAPPMQTVFASAPLGPADWLKVIAVGALVMLAVELEKWIVRRTATGRRLLRPELPAGGDVTTP